MADTVLADRYRLGARIGTGASAQVFAAHDERLDRRVAVKVLDDDAAMTADPAARQRFEIESRTAARFIHPNAVTVFDAGADNGTLYVVMELVAGGSLAELLARAGPLPSADVARIGAQVASALDAAHAAGIIHRDVKPANVLLDLHGDAKLADFGIAHRLDEIGESLTSTGMVMGTRHYVSPEQARGDTLGPPSDVFSLGVTLFEAVTGVRPPSALERTVEHSLDARAILPSVDPVLAGAIASATAIPLDERCPTARALATLGAAAASRPEGGTAVMPAHLRPAGLSDDLVAERRRRRRVRIAGVCAALAVAGIVLAVALGQGNSLDDASTTSLPAATVPTSVPSATTLPATTAVPTTAPPTTVAPTAPPTTPPPPAELIPGFPLPADIDAFLASLAADPDLVGPRGDELAAELSSLLGSNRGKFEDRQAELMDHIEEWRDDGELDPVVAAAALAFVDDLNRPNGRGGGDGGD